jgi:hypothetical protein
MKKHIAPVMAKMQQTVFLASQDQSPMPIWDHPNSLPWNTMDQLKRFEYIFHDSYQLY